MVRWVLPAFVFLLLMPLSAAAADNCRHKQNHAARHAARAEAVENVPAGGAAAHCPDHSGQPRAITTNMAPKCNMEGCCIKADGPLSTGLSNRLPTNDDNALSVSAVQPQTGGRLVSAAPHRLHPQRNLPEPDPRPPAA